MFVGTKIVLNMFTYVHCEIQFVFVAWWSIRTTVASNIKWGNCEHHSLLELLLELVDQCSSYWCTNSVTLHNKD